MAVLVFVFLDFWLYGYNFGTEYAVTARDSPDDFIKIRRHLSY